MRKQGKRTKWKATDSAPMDTAQKNDGKIRNQTTEKSEGRFPLTTIIVIAIFLTIVGVLVFGLGLI